MSTELRDLYQEVILDHSKKPRNFRVLEHADRKAEGFNPLCGDRLTLYLELDGERVKNIGFQGAGCAIFKASASMMTEAVKGKTKAETEQLFQKVHHMLSRDPSASFEPAGLGKLAAFSGVSEFPVRVKCATLAWHTLRSGLAAKKETVSTEE